MSDEQAFLKAIADSPADVGHRLVFADWLDEHGDTERAEFIRVQCRLAELGPYDPDRATLEDREHALLAQHESTWVGKLAKQVTRWSFRRGCVEAIDTGARKFLTNARKIFALAPVQDVRLTRLGAGATAQDVAACVFLERVRALELQGAITSHDLDIVLASEHIHDLRALTVGEMVFTHGNSPVPALEKRLARLEEVTFEVTPLELMHWWGRQATNRPSVLRRLTLKNNGFDTVAEGNLADQPALAGLTYLALPYNNNVRVAAARALAGSPHLTNLLSLNLHGCNIGVNGARAIGASDTLANLQSLDVRGNHFGTSGLRALLDGGKLTQLTELYLGMNGLDGNAIDLLLAWPGLAQLRALHFYNNEDIGDAAVARLIDSGKLAALHELDLGHVNLQQQGLLALVRSVYLSGLLRLNLGGNRLGDGGVRLLASSPYLANLRALDLRAADIGDVGARAILESSFLRRLHTLNLRVNRIRPPLIEALQDRFGPGVVADTQVA